MEPSILKPRVQVTLDDQHRVVVACPVLTELTEDQTQRVVGAVRSVAESVLAGVAVPCVTCEDRASALWETRYVVAATTWSLIDAVMWGGRVLDARAVASEEIAEGLLDRIGEVLSHLTSRRVTVSADRSVVLTDQPAPSSTSGDAPVDGAGGTPGSGPDIDVARNAAPGSDAGPDVDPSARGGVR